MATRDRFLLRNIYLYLVCLISLVIIIFATVNLVNGVVQLLYPDPGYWYSEPIKISGDELVDQAAQAQQQAAAIDSARRQAVLGVVSAATMLLIAVPVYAYHWRRVQRENKAPAEAGQK
jgi:hypothetical protein